MPIPAFDPSIDTAGNQYVDANGTGLSGFAGRAGGNWLSNFLAQTGGDYAWASVLYARYANGNLLSQGNAFVTSKGVISIAAAKAQLQAHGYSGPWDAASIGQAYALLQTPPPAAPTPNQPVPGPGSGGHMLRLPPLSPPVLIALGLGAYFLFGRRRR